MYLHQFLLEVLEAQVKPGRVLIIYGPRRVGKTTLILKFLENKTNYLSVSSEDIDVQYYLASQSVSKLSSFVGQHKLLVIDEAQKISNIGLNLKLLVDHFPHLSIIATGSSSFDLANQVGEPLTGRKKTLQMFPLSQIELGETENIVQTRSNLEERLIYGSYPEIILTKTPGEKIEYLRELVSSYLYKDILELDGVRKSDQLIKLLQLLAFQIGKEVSHTEIGKQLGINKGTVERYLDLLEKAFVLIKVSGFSRNLRKEISKQNRYYFYDVGIRNAIINQFNHLPLRNDVGEIWENYLIMERLKKQEYKKISSNNYYWRTYDQKEIDWVEEREGVLHGYEIKWQTKNIKEPALWRQTYPNALFQIINNENYLEFIT